MEQRSLGTADFTVPAIGLGCNNLGRPATATESREGTAAVINAALDAGVTFLDNADVYGSDFGVSETLLGEVLGRRRDEALIVTKFGHPLRQAPDIDPSLAPGSRAYVRAAIDGSLTRLRADHVDLYFHHYPDDSTSVTETIGALEELVTAGKIRAYGVSQYPAERIAEARAVADRLGSTTFVSSEDELSLVARAHEADRIPAAEEAGLGFLPFFPLANGLLTGKYSRGSLPKGARLTDIKPEIAETADWDAIEAYRGFCDARGVSMLHATFGWLLARDCVASVIAGATRPEQVASNAAAGASGAWRPTADDLGELDAIFPG